MTRPMLEKDSKAPPDAPVSIKRILVPFDFSEPAAHALDFAQKLAPSFGASVEALYVAPYLANAGLPVSELGAIPVAGPSVEEILVDGEARLHEALAAQDTRRRSVIPPANLPLVS